MLRPGIRTLAAAAGGGTALFFLLHSQVPDVGGYIGATAIAWLASCGLASLLPVLLQAVGIGFDKTGRDGKDAVHHARVLLAIFLLVVAVEAVNGRFLRFTSVAFPQTWDHALAALDTRFGFQPAFAIGRFAQKYNWILNYSFLAYNGLLLGLISLMALESRRTFLDSLTTWFQFSVAGVIGGGLYLFCPASGPRYAFAQFPAFDPILSLADLLPTVVAPAARNGMPSLHTAWVVLLFLRARSQGRLVRLYFGVLMVGTLVATLGQGEHYLLDLVVAVPLAVGVSQWNLTVFRRSQWFVGAALMSVSLLEVIALPRSFTFLYAHGWLLVWTSFLTVTVPLFVNYRTAYRASAQALAPVRAQ